MGAEAENICRSQIECLAKGLVFSLGQQGAIKGCAQGTNEAELHPKRMEEQVEVDLRSIMGLILDLPSLKYQGSWSLGSVCLELREASGRHWQQKPWVLVRSIETRVRRTRTGRNPRSGSTLLQEGKRNGSQFGRKKSSRVRS